MSKKKNIIAGMLFLMTIVALSATAGETEGASSKKELEVKVDKTATTVKITATGKSGYHCNTLYPWKLTVDGPGQEKTVYRKKDAKAFSKDAVVFQVPYKKGQKAEMKMSVCNDAQCIMHTEKLSW
jgi:hypothetical protein